MENYHILHQIGEGSFGKVFKGRRKNTGQILALKFISKSCFFNQFKQPNPTTPHQHTFFQQDILHNHFSIIKKRNKSEKDLANLRQEIEILRRLKHENIILLLDAFETPHEFCVVTEIQSILQRYTQAVQEYPKQTKQ